MMGRAGRSGRARSSKALPARIYFALWAQVITGIEADEHGNARVLDADEWQRRRQRLEKLGGPPLLD